MLYFIASIAFAADNGGSKLEKAAVVRKLGHAPYSAKASLSLLSSLLLLFHQAFGFLAFLVFLADVGIFWMKRGSPFRVEQTTNGGLTGVGAEPVPAQPELQNLNTNNETA